MTVADDWSEMAGHPGWDQRPSLIGRKYFKNRPATWFKTTRDHFTLVHLTSLVWFTLVHLSSLIWFTLFHLSSLVSFTNTFVSVLKDQDVSRCDTEERRYVFILLCILYLYRRVNTLNPLKYQILLYSKVSIVNCLYLSGISIH